MKFGKNKVKKEKVKKPGIRAAFKDATNLVFKKGNIWALAVGVLIGAAFGAVVNSLANDIIMNAIAKAGGVKGVEALAWGTTARDANDMPLDGIRYGKFLAALFSFLIIAVCLILATAISLYVWRKIVRRREAKNGPAVPAGPSTEELILAELKKLNENLGKGKKA